MIFQGSFFCSQECFTGSWDLHKALHKLAKGGNPSSCSKPNRSFNPWPGYVFTGKLRPAEQSATRVVPDHIPRPDYADDPQGTPISEQKLKGNTYIRQLDDEEIEFEAAKKIAELFDNVTLSKQVNIRYSITADVLVEMPYNADADEVAGDIYLDRVDFSTYHGDADILETDPEIEDWNIVS